MIICLSGFVIAGTSPTPMAVASRADISVVDRVGVGVGVGLGVGGGVRYYSPHQHLLQQHYAPPLAPHRAGAGRSSSSSAESVSSRGASPPAPGAWASGAGARRVRTLYACLGESEGELSFEPNQIITNVCASGEPGWLRGTLNGKAGLVPENYVEPLP